MWFNDHALVDLIERDPVRREDIRASEYDLIRLHTVVHQWRVQCQRSHVGLHVEGSVSRERLERAGCARGELPMLPIELNAERLRQGHRYL